MANVHCIVEGHSATSLTVNLARPGFMTLWLLMTALWASSKTAPVVRSSTTGRLRVKSPRRPRSFRVSYCPALPTGKHNTNWNAPNRYEVAMLKKCSLIRATHHAQAMLLCLPSCPVSLAKQCRCPCGLLYADRTEKGSEVAFWLINNPKRSANSTTFNRDATPL